MSGSQGVPAGDSDSPTGTPTGDPGEAFEKVIKYVGAVSKRRRLSRLLAGRFVGKTRKLLEAIEQSDPKFIGDLASDLINNIGAKDSNPRRILVEIVKSVLDDLDVPGSSREVSIELTNDANFIESGEDTPDEFAEREEWVADLREALDELGKEHKQILNRRYWDNATMEMIGSDLNISKQRISEMLPNIQVHLAVALSRVRAKRR